MKHALLLLYAVFAFTGLSAQNSLKRPVLKVQTEGDNGYGTAFLTGQRDGRWYALTASHVVENAAAGLTVTLFDRRSTPIPARVENQNVAADMALISFPAPAGMAPPSSFRLHLKPPAFQAKVVLVGFPLGTEWNINLQPLINDTEWGYNPRFFSLTPTGLDRGNSGSPVLTPEYELLGMAVSFNSQGAKVVGTELLERLIAEWNAPVNLMTGIPLDAPASANPREVIYQQDLRSAETAFNGRDYRRARDLFQRALSYKNTTEILQQYQAANAQVKKDSLYQVYLSQGYETMDMSKRLGHFQEAQKQRDTQEIRDLIAETQQRIQQVDAARRNDQAAWEKARTANTIAAYAQYLRDNPAGGYRTQAQEAIRKLEAVPTPTVQPANGIYTDPWAGTMVRISGGTFQMGSNEGDSDEKPVHSVTVGDFWIGRYEVTQKQWWDIMGTNPSKYSGCDECPVEQVSWNDVQEFIKKLNAKTGHTYRLPTEAEWEYAAGGGSGSRTKWAGTNSESSLDNYAWYSANSGSKTHPVGEKQPNALGLYDMSGNVWEWCEDDWHSNYVGAPTNGRSWVDNPRGAYRLAVGVAGTTTRSIAALRVASATTRLAATATSASALPVSFEACCPCLHVSKKEKRRGLPAQGRGAERSEGKARPQQAGQAREWLIPA